MNWKNNKAVPIIVALLVLIILFLWTQGFFADPLQKQLENQKCFNDTEKLMNDFKLALEKTATYKQPSTFEFTPLACLENEKFLVIKSDDEKLCQRACLSSSSSCILLRYSSSKITGIQDKCINISPETQFSTTTENPSFCDEVESFSPVKIDFDKTLEKGEYYFVYSTSETPIVCSYLKSD